MSQTLCREVISRRAREREGHELGGVVQKSGIRWGAWLLAKPAGESLRVHTYEIDVVLTLFAKSTGCGIGGEKGRYIYHTLPNNCSYSKSRMKIVNLFFPAASAG